MNNHNVLKKLLALALSLAMVLSVAPITAFAADTAPLGISQQPMGGQIGTFAHAPENTPLGELGGLLYTSLGGDNAKVSGYDPVALPADVVIPATVTFGGDTYNVTSIGDYAFDSCYSLTSVVIPNSVTTIGDAAFYYCTGLTSVTIPDSVESIGDYAFVGCSGLTSVTIPDSVKTIGDTAFANCQSLTSVVIPNSVTSIGDYAFVSCTSLESVTIGNSVTAIGNGAFASCTGLTSITIPNSVTTIGTNAFADCYALTSITFRSVTPPLFGTDVFLYFDNLTTINVPLGSEAAYKAALPDYASLVVGVDMTPPTGSGSSSSSSSSGGSNKPDTRPIVGGTTTGATSTNRPLTTAEATKQFDTALAVKPAGGTTLSIKVQNATSVSKEVLAELAAAAKKNGVTLTVHFDTVVGGKVVSRLSLNPATATTDLNLNITENKALAARFSKYYSNPLAVYTVPAAGSVAIKLPENLKPEDLVIYSYDKVTNTYSQLTGAKLWVDSNGYLHFDVAAGTDVVISQGKLVKK